MDPLSILVVSLHVVVMNSLHPWVFQCHFFFCVCLERAHVICKNRRLMLGLFFCRGGRFSDSFDVFLWTFPCVSLLVLFFDGIPFGSSFLSPVPCFVVRFDRISFVAILLDVWFSLGLLLGLACYANPPFSLEDDAWSCGTVDWDVVARASFAFARG